MARPRKNKLDSQDISNDVKSHQNEFPLMIVDPTSIAPRILEAYSQEELDKFLSNGWLIYEEQDTIMPSWLDTPGQEVPGGRDVLPSTIRAYGYQQITSLSSATALTVPLGATIALIQAETQDVRWRDDGTSPTASVGMIIGAGTTLPYTGDLNAIKFIEATASAKLNISYYG